MKALLAALACACILALGVAATAQQPASSPRAAQIQDHLRQILSRPEFSVAPRQESVLQKIGRWLRERWEDFQKWWERVFSFGGRAGAGTAQVVMWLVLALLIVAIAYVLAFGVRRLGWGGGKGWKRSSIGVAAEEIEERIDDPDALLTAAKELAAAGQYRRAYRAIFLAILLRLDRLELIRFDRARTNGEYLRALRSRPDVLSLVRPLTNDFDLRWYGGKAVDEPDYRRVMSVYDRIVSTVQPQG